MTIYKLQQMTMSDQKMTDLNLPRTVGFYTTYDLALAARALGILRRRGLADADLHTTPNDYAIHTLTVLDSREGL